MTEEKKIEICPVCEKPLTGHLKPSKIIEGEYKEEIRKHLSLLSPSCVMSKTHKHENKGGD